MRYIICVLMIISNGCVIDPDFYLETMKSKNGTVENNPYYALSSEINTANDYFVNGHYNLSALHWEHIREQIRLREIDYLYSPPLYLDDARFSANIAWAQLNDSNWNQARKNYQSVFSVLRDNGKKYYSNQKAMLDDTHSYMELQRLITLDMSSQARKDIKENGYFSSLSSSNYSKGINRFNDLFNEAYNARDSMVFGKGIPDLGILNEVHDDGVRIVLLPSMGAATNIGKLSITSSTYKGYCTAALVGYKIAVTAAHCVTHKNSLIPPNYMEIYFNDLYIPDSVEVKKVITPNNNPFNPIVVDYDIDEEDWAILILDRHPTGRGYLGVSSNVSIKDRFAVFGYSSDLNDGHYLSVHWGCKQLNPMNGKLYSQYNCRIESGASGGPIIKISGEDAGWMIVGINSFSNSINKLMGGAKIASMKSVLNNARAGLIESDNLALNNNKYIREGLYSWNDSCLWSGVWFGGDGSILSFDGSDNIGKDLHVIGSTSVNKVEINFKGEKVNSTVFKGYYSIGGSLSGELSLYNNNGLSLHSLYDNFPLPASNSHTFYRKILSGNCYYK